MRKKERRKKIREALGVSQIGESTAPRPMKMAYVASPYSGDIEMNIAYLKKCLRELISMSIIPVASHIYLPQVLNDNIPEEREIGTSMGIRMIDYCDALISFEDRGVSKGMVDELTHATNIGKPTARVKLWTDD